MDKSQYEAMMHTEDGHWWFRGRRKVIARFVKGMKLPVGAKILEVGCGGGGNLPLLSAYAGELKAVEPNEVLREHATSRGICEIRSGTLPEGLPYGDEKFDLICLFDVLEHVENDSAAISAIREKLTENGRILLTVPASPSLWSHHDVENQHFRRYTRGTLTALLSGRGLSIGRVSYFNTFLFPAIWLARKISGNAKKAEGKPDLEMPAYGLSWLFYGLMSLESSLLSLFNFPFGVSLVCEARR
jgi:SAM-dependent methyltransferase